jgi:hypothetical protein
MTDEEIGRLWRRFMMAKINGMPLWVEFADARIDAAALREAFFAACRHSDAEFRIPPVADVVRGNHPRQE